MSSNTERANPDPPTPGGIDRVDAVATVLTMMRATVAASREYRGSRPPERSVIEDTIADWSGRLERALSNSKDSPASDPSALRALIARWRENARLARPLESAPNTSEKRQRVLKWMMWRMCADELEALVPPVEATPQIEDQKDQCLPGTTGQGNK